MKTVGIVLPVGQSKKLLDNRGQWSLWTSELAIYKELGWKYELFEYYFTGRLRFIESLLLPLFERTRLAKCDILQAVHLSGSIPCMVAKIFYRKPFLLRYAYRYDKFARVEGKWFQWILAFILTPLACRTAVAVMVPTEEIARFVMKNGAKYVVVISNGVDTHRFVPAKETRSKKQEAIRILFVGRFEPQKNLIALVNALRLVQEKKLDRFRKRLVLIFVGQGSQRTLLEDTARKVRISLKIVSDVSNDRLVPYYQHADIFVLPSLIEGHPKALLEAMSCGLPVVASRIPGCTDIITDRVDGLLVKPSIEAIRDGLEQLIAHRSFANHLGKRARETMVERFEKHQVLEQEVQLMNKLI